MTMFAVDQDSWLTVLRRYLLVIALGNLALPSLAFWLAIPRRARR